PVPGIGMASGFKLMVEDRGSLGLEALQKQTDQVAEKARASHELFGVFTLFRSDTPQFYLEIDRTKAKALGVSINDLTQPLQVYVGSMYVNSFNEFGRFWQVKVMAGGSFRNQARGLNLLQVRNDRGQVVPLGTLVQVRDDIGPVMVQRYNLYPAAPVIGI